MSRQLDIFGALASDVAPESSKAPTAQPPAPVPASHEEAMRLPRQGFESAVVKLFRGIADYADAHRERYGGRIMDDGYIGEAWYTLGHALIDLLNGETGRLDCATLDRQVRDLIEGGGTAASTKVVRELTSPAPPPTRAPKAKSPSAEDIGKRRLSERERELLRNLRVDDNFAVYVPEEFIEDWAILKAIMQALGGSWSRKTKKRHGGFAFADDADAQELVRLALETGEILDARAAEFFETGPELAREMAEWLKPRPGERLLEPSAGKGALIRAVRDVCPNVYVNCVEVFPENRTELVRQGWEPIAADFLTLSEHHVGGRVDLVIANPPFSKRQDVSHITHAIHLLHPGGRLAAIASAGVLYRDDKMGRDFRALVQRHNGTITENPDGSFAHAGTLVRTVQVRLTKS